MSSRTPRFLWCTMVLGSCGRHLILDRSDDIIDRALSIEPINDVSSVKKLSFDRYKLAKAS